MARKPLKPSKASIKAKADRAEALADGKPAPEVSAEGMDRAVKAEIMGEAGTPTPPPPKRKRGRPSKYDPKFCEIVIECGEQGMGKAEIAYEIGIDRETLDVWAGKHEDFSRACHRAREASLAWWAAQGRQGVWGGKQFNAPCYQFQVRNRFPDDWKADPLIDVGNGSLTININKSPHKAAA